MKKLEYKPFKWEKRKAALIENSKYDYDEVSLLTKLYNEQKIDEESNDEISAMVCAISQKNSDGFENALAERIRKIRKFNLDNYICADFIAMALIKEAKKVGMNFYSEYIEVDMKISN